MTEPQSHEVIPSAKRLMKSLRDVGYDFSSAVADIVDNSIEAGATKIEINVEFHGDKSFVTIADNGRGMTPEQIIEAMRFGSDRDYSKEDLGKFGLGLKTSSLSQCRFFAVASRTAKQDKAEAYCWDMDYVEKTDKWHVLSLEDKTWAPVVYDPLKKNTGTVVLWWKVDRMLGYEHPYGEHANKKLISMCRDLEEHLAMVFHRFLTGRVLGRETVRMSINGNPIKSWDPFVRYEAKTLVLPPIKLAIEHEGTKGEVLIEPYVLPSQQEFSTIEKFDSAAGPANWNQQQGFYIYRAGRMIQSGGWCRLRTPDEHTKLARIALSFSPDLDDALKLNVAKRQVQLPAEYRDAIDKIIQPIVKIARERYDRKDRRDSHASGGNLQWPRIDTSDPSQLALQLEKQPFKRIVPDDAPPQVWTLDEVEQKALSVAKPHEKSIIENVFERLRKKLWGQL